MLKVYDVPQMYRVLDKYPEDFLLSKITIRNFFSMSKSL